MRLYRFCIVLICMFVLVGCAASGKPSITPSESINETKQILPEPIEEKKEIQPIMIGENEFNQVHDWIDEETVIYSYSKEHVYYVDIYNLFTKESKNIFTSNDPIVQVIVHPDRKKILFQTAPSTYQANIAITDVKGKQITQQNITSSELSITWNHTDDDQLLITAFAEDWTYDVYNLDIKSEKLEKIPHLQPFFKWLDNDFILEQRWDDESISLSAPLWKTNIYNDEQSTKILNDLYYFQLLTPTLLMTITVPNADETIFHYHFYDEEEEINRFETNNITQFSDWVVPHYSFNEKNQTFYTFLPNHHGSIDTYGGLYTLKEFDINDKIERTLIEEIENKPLRCDESSRFCLYGYQLESIIDLEKGTIETLIQFGTKETS